MAIPVPCEIGDEQEIVEGNCTQLYLISPYLVETPPPLDYDVGSSAIINGCAYMDEIATRVPVVSEVSFQVSGSNTTTAIFCEDFDRVNKTGLAGTISFTTLSPTTCADSKMNVMDAVNRASLAIGKEAKMLYAIKHPDGSWVYGEAVVTSQNWVLAARGTTGRQFELNTSGQIHYARCNAFPVATTSQIEAAPSAVTVGTPITIIVTAYDVASNIVASGGASVFVTHNGANLGDIHAESQDNGLYTATYIPIAADAGNTITFGFKLNNVAGTDTAGVTVS
jgi:hypothetical protein